MFQPRPRLPTQPGLARFQVVQWLGESDSTDTFAEALDRTGRGEERRIVLGFPPRRCKLVHVEELTRHVAGGPVLAGATQGCRRVVHE